MKFNLRCTKINREFTILDKNAAEYLKITIHKVHRRLLNKYSNTNFIENKDYIKYIINYQEVYLLNSACFDKLALVDESI